MSLLLKSPMATIRRFKNRRQRLETQTVSDSGSKHAFGSLLLSKPEKIHVSRGNPTKCHLINR